jgi:rubrerythrin
MPELDQQSLEKLKSLLQLAYSAELAAAYAYRGHWHSVKSAAEKARIQEIENEELHHRLMVGQMLGALAGRPSKTRELRAAFIGRALALLCHLSGWLAPMYGAGRLESHNIREYEAAARHARAVGRHEFVDCLLTMAEVEWEHEHYFRARVSAHRWARRIPLWPAPPPKETIRISFEKESLSSEKRVAEVERPAPFGYTGSP